MKNYLLLLTIVVTAPIFAMEIDEELGLQTDVEKLNISDARFRYNVATFQANQPCTSTINIGTTPKSLPQTGAPITRRLPRKLQPQQPQIKQSLSDDLAIQGMGFKEEE